MITYETKSIVLCLFFFFLMDNDLNALFDKLDMVMLQNKIILEILNAMEKKPASKFIDKNSTEYKSKKLSI